MWGDEGISFLINWSFTKSCCQTILVGKYPKNNWTAQVGGNTEDTFRRSPPWSLPPHRTATPSPRRGQLQEEPPLLGIQAALTLSPTPSHYPPFYTIPSGCLAAIEVSTRRLHRPSTGKYVLQSKHPFWQLQRWSIPENSTWDCSGQGHLWRVKTPSPVTNHQDPTTIGDFRPFTLPVSRDQNYFSLN